MSWAVTRTNGSSPLPAAKLESGRIAETIPLGFRSSTNAGRLLSSEVINRGSNHKVIHDIRETPVGDGTFVRRTNSYTQLGSGLCYRQADGKWTDSKPEIVVDSSGKGSGQKAANLAKFGPNLNSSGVVEFTTPFGKKFRSHVLGVSLHDAKSGKSVQIGQLQDSIGTIVQGEEVIYTNAFIGISADVRYRYKRSGVSQDVIFKDSLPSPAEFGMDPRTTSVEVWTEFLESPQPTAQGKAPMENGRENIQTLEFGDIRIGQGRAFLTATDGDSPVRPAAKIGDKRVLPVNPHSVRNGGTSVRKEWLTLEGRTFLIESVPYQEVKLPRKIISPAPGATPASGVPKRSANSISPASESDARVVSGARVPPTTMFSSINTTDRINLAAHFPLIEGYVLDYEMVETLPELTLWSDTTYFIQDVVSVTSLTVEGGAVVKFDQDAELEVSYIDCKTAPYRPAVFTSKNDDSIGEPIPHLPTETPDDCRGAGAFFSWTYAPRDIHDIRMMWLNWPLVFDSPLYVSQPIIRSCQFVHCGVVASVTSQQNSEIPDVKFQNCLVSQCYSLSGGGARFSSEHVTLDQITTMGCGSEQLTVQISNNSATEDATIWIYDSDAAVDWDTDGWNIWPVFNNPSQVYVDGGVIGSTMSQDFVFAAQSGKSYTMWGHGQWYQLQSFGCTFQPLFDHLSLSINGDGELSGSVSGVSLCPTLVSMTNCILANVGNTSTLTGDHNGFYNCASFGSNPVPTSESPFQNSGGGNYYLKGNSPFRGTGISSVNPTLLASLKRKTTTPPIDFPRLMRLTGELSLFPQIQRYKSGAPDLGYYYDVVDYTAAALFVDGGYVTVNPGTVVGFRDERDLATLHPPFWPGWAFGWTYFGIDVLRGSTFVSHGTPEHQNVFADMQTVQESVDTPAIFLFLNDMINHSPYWGYGFDRPPATFDFRFSNFSVAPGCYHFGAGGVTFSSAVNLSLRDCNLFGGWFLITYGEVEEPTPCDVVFENNLFDTVHIELAPDCLWCLFPEQNPYVDMAVTAHNNLFRRASLLLYPPSIRDWVFKDNLFDKEEFRFIEPITGGLERDYNAYRLLLESELRMNGLGGIPSQTSPGNLSANEITLNSEVAYQTGPMGAYYLPTSSTLWNAGSRTAADAGLFHYTTRLDQTKEGSEGSGNLVNIGLHYVATASSGSTLPKDTDADGVSDFVEDANGNGDPNDVSSGIETDPAVAMTDGTTPDATSTIYDDADLDGDGMVGRIERELVKNSLVLDNPLVLQLTNGDWSEFRKFKLPINYDFLTSVADVRLWFETGTEPEVQTRLKDTSDDSIFLIWNTTFDPPGQHYLQPRIYLKSVESSAEIPRVEACGPLIPFQTDNVVQFVNLYSTFDASGAILFAKTYPGSEYSVEIRGENGSHLKTISGTVPTSSGEIDITWDLRSDDPGQTLFTGDSFSAAYTITPPSSPSQTRTLRASRSAFGFGDGLFTVAYRWPNPSLVGRNNALDNCVQWGVVDVLLTPGAPNPNNYSSFFNDFTPIASTYNVYGGAGHLANQGRVNALLDDLSRTESAVRNFFWEGHGEPSLIGKENDIYILAKDVSERLGNGYEIVEPIPEGAPFIRDYRNHPYRFVFIDGCHAGKTGIWAEAFGIPGGKISYAEIVNHSDRAQAFLGFTEAMTGYNTAAGCEWYSHTLTAFFKLWMGGNRRLQESFEIASDKDKLWSYLQNVLLDFGVTYEHTSPLSGSVSSKYKSTTQFGAIYGYPFITRDGVLPPP